MPVTEKALIPAPKLNFDKTIVPIPGNPALPFGFWVAAFAGQRGSGKSYSTTQLVRQFEISGVFHPVTNKRYAMRTILISPTAAANACYQALDTLDPDDIHEFYSDKLIKLIFEDLKHERQETETYWFACAAYKKFMSVADLSGLSMEEAVAVERNNFEEPIPPKYPDGCYTVIVLDDLVGTTAYRTTGYNPLVYHTLKNRHGWAAMAFLVQTVKSLPRAIRVNSDLVCSWRFAEIKMCMEDLYECVASHLTPHQFAELMQAACVGDHDFLTCDFTRPKPQWKRSLWTLLTQTGPGISIKPPKLPAALPAPK